MENSTANPRTFVIEVCCVTAGQGRGGGEAIEPHSVWTGRVSIRKTVSWRRRWALTQGNMVCAVFCSSKARLNCSKCFLASLAIRISNLCVCVCVCFLFLSMAILASVFMNTRKGCLFSFWWSVSVFLSNQHHQTCLLHMHVHIASIRRHERRSSREWD